MKFEKTVYWIIKFQESIYRSDGFKILVSKYKKQQIAGGNFQNNKDFNSNSIRFWPHCVNIVCTTAIARSTDRANRLDQWGCKWLTALCSLHQLYTRTRRERRTELTRLLPGSPSAQKPVGTFGAGGDLSQPTICQKTLQNNFSNEFFDNFLQMWNV